MEYESNKPVNTRYLWGRGDKSLLLRIQMAISALSIFIGIVQATNVFLLNKAQDNPISFGIFVIIVLVVVLSGVTIIWAILTSKRLAMSEDIFTSTNTKFSQILLFLTLVLFTLYVVFFTLFKFSKTDLFNTAQAAQVEYNTAYENSYNEHQQWVSNLGYISIVLLIITAFTQEVMTDSRACTNLMIFLVGTVLLFVSFYIIHAIGVLNSVYNYPSLDLEQWPLTSLKVIAVLTLFILIITMIVNFRRKEVSFLLAGTLFILIIALIVPPTGAIFRQYNIATKYYSDHCSEELGHIDQAYLAQEGCKNKYLYREGSPKDCGNRFNDCFESIDDMRKLNKEKKSFLTTAWEESLYPKANTEPRLAGLSQQCCGTVVNIYARPLLKIAGLSLAYIILAFLLVCFLYKNSAHPSQPQELVLSSASRNLLLLVFAIVFIVGGLYTISSSHQSDLVRRDTVVINKVITIHKSSPSSTYHEINKCMAFQYFEDEALVNIDFKSMMLSEINIASASTAYCESCTSPDLLVVVQTIRGVSDSCQSDFKFKYPAQQDDKTKRVHIIPSSLAQPLALESICFDAVTKHNRCVPCQNYLGIVGDPTVVVNYLRQNVEACNRSGMKFVVQAYQVDQKLFASSAQGDTSSIYLKSANPKKSISHKSKNPSQSVSQSTNEIVSLVTPKTQPEDSPRLLASLNKHTVQLNVRDISNNTPIANADVFLYENYEGENTCEPGIDAKIIFQGTSNQSGLIDLDFIYKQLPATRYTVHVKASSQYAVNCRTFSINEKRKFLDIGLSPSLGEHQIRFVLEWGAESSNDNTSDLDIYLSTNSIEENWLCYSSYFSTQCAGSVHHGDSLGDKISSEAITLQNLGQTKYLVFFKMPIVSATNSAVDNSIISQLKPILKVYTQGQNKPTQASVFDSSLQKGTFPDFENNYRFANLAWCINGVSSEIVKNAGGLTYPVAWQVIDNDHSSLYDLPLASVVC